ncbi:hypothetical protein HY380_00280 [Candidatus Saccharibacteria bacterium]|nr:hypothetical protein [Candidatus Saccharibacteria bacterium]
MIKINTRTISKPGLGLGLIIAANLVSPSAVYSATPQELQRNLKANPIVEDIQMIINFLSAGVGVIVLAVIIIGGIQYITAGDKPEATMAAKKRVINGVTALIAFMLMYAFLQWLVPGGVF